MTVVEIVVSVALIALSAFFVAVEFALVAARTHRLEEAARTSASARAALRSAKDLSLLLAGSQLGITLCVLGLGAVTKPAVDDALGPLLEGWGVPAAVAGVVSFVLSLVVVTFLHLVVGEMAPKSWAIAHPERSAVLLALPMRAFMTVTRPLLLLLDGAANRCLRLLGVEPVDEMAGGRTPDDLRELVEHSASVGALDGGRRDRVLAVLDLDATPVRDLAHEPVEVEADDDAEAVRAVSRTSGHLRLVVREAGRPVGYVHVRDTLARDPRTPARSMTRALLSLDAGTTLHTAATRMREERTHLAVVEADGDVLGVVALADVVGRLLPA
ncbi:hemolysin family protein [Actinomycetospora endophytica]|uniref:Hemolysin family protein n=1 Tax=Actinomycetospora endophytica TaxID=2291215 RepID=A0ABS8P4D6_9PSEU|nr:hemolysin family protein [Actinomycetospora endophytica]MCD2192410.1 hemolysin family protein [Actinomycetospora endophytica]